YLKESAAEWYEEIKSEVKYWKTKSEDEQERRQSFYHMLMEHRVNINNFLSDDYIVRMFLSRLKNNNATFVAVAAPKNLKEAIAAARRVELGNYYSQHTSVNSLLPQPRVGTDFEEIKEKVNEISLNYAVLAKMINSNNHNRKI
ncbi:13252_t:CDS:2, partial [Gigaspora rosea]